MEIIKVILNKISGMLVVDLVFLLVIFIILKISKHILKNDHVMLRETKKFRWAIWFVVILLFVFTFLDGYAVYKAITTVVSAH